MGGVVKSIKKGFKQIGRIGRSQIDAFRDPIGEIKDYVSGAVDLTGINTALKGFTPKQPDVAIPAQEVTTKRAIPVGEQGRPVPPAFGGAVVTSPLGLVDNEDQALKRKRLLGS